MLIVVLRPRLPPARLPQRCRLPKSPRDLPQHQQTTNLSPLILSIGLKPRRHLSLQKTWPKAPHPKPMEQVHRLPILLPSQTRQTKSVRRRKRRKTAENENASNEMPKSRSTRKALQRQTNLPPSQVPNLAKPLLSILPPLLLPFQTQMSSRALQRKARARVHPLPNAHLATHGRSLCV